jgi:hypothetical protein
MGVLSASRIALLMSELGTKDVICQGFLKGHRDALSHLGRHRAFDELFQNLNACNARAQITDNPE